MTNKIIRFGCKVKISPPSYAAVYAVNDSRAGEIGTVIESSSSNRYGKGWIVEFDDGMTDDYFETWLTPIDDGVLCSDEITNKNDKVKNILRKIVLRLDDFDECLAMATAIHYMDVWDRLQNNISKIRRTMDSNNDEYRNGYLCALSVVEETAAQIEEEINNERSK